MATECPYCHRIAQDEYICPLCEEEVMIFKSGEGPWGTYECVSCSTPKKRIGFRTTINGLIKVTDQCGRYKDRR